ncbi:MAG: non-homologous end-joining DNA ligase [Acidimicrobiia bacterium]|nr:non-homologous end-joining DNA ligase [Acidimicrobiia bacterium]
MSAIDSLDDEARSLLEEASIPHDISPMLATLVDDPFSDPGWVYERKLDGVRLLAFGNGGEVRLRTRNDKDRTDTYPEITEVLAGQPPEAFVVDGEVVAFSGSVTSFSRLQQRMRIDDPERARATGVAVFFYVFDVLHLDGHDTTGLPLRTRKSLLREALDFGDPLRYTPHRNEDGESFLADACERGWEGLIAKDASATYTQGRSRSWLKFKCVARQELVIGGFTEPQGERHGFGALLVGHYDDDELVYAGKVGTGYDDDTLDRLGDRLRDLERDDPPFARGRLPTKGVHWVDPDLVAEIGFTEWTDAGRLRHPRFLGLRHDKDPTDVVRERPA